MNFVVLVDFLVHLSILHDYIISFLALSLYCKMTDSFHVYCGGSVIYEFCIVLMKTRVVSSS